MHLAAFDYANAETGRTLARIAAEGNAEERIQRDHLREMDLQLWLQWGGKREDLAGCNEVAGKIVFSVEALLTYLQRSCEAVRERHSKVPAERFVADVTYRAMSTEMLATGAAAESCMRLYLEDPSVQMQQMMRRSLMFSLMQGHRGYLGFLARTLPDAGEVRVAAAARLCQAIGLIQESPDEVDEDGLTPLIRAAADGAGARVLQSLAAARADLEARDQGTFKATAIYWAAGCGHADVVRELGRLGAQVDAVAAFGCTPIWMAAERGHLDVVEVLAQLKADVNAAAGDGRTPIFMAADGGHTAAVEALGRLGADVNIVSAEFGAPLENTRRKGHTNAAEALERLVQKAAPAAGVGRVFCF